MRHPRLPQPLPLPHRSSSPPAGMAASSFPAKPSGPAIPLPPPTRLVMQAAGIRGMTAAVAIPVAASGAPTDAAVATRETPLARGTPATQETPMVSEAAVSLARRPSLLLSLPWNRLLNLKAFPATLLRRPKPPISCTLRYPRRQARSSRRPPCPSRWLRWSRSMSTNPQKPPLPIASTPRHPANMYRPRLRSRTPPRQLKSPPCLSHATPSPNSLSTRPKSSIPRP